MRILSSAIVTALLMSVSVSAQTVPTDLMPITVTPTCVIIKTDCLPRSLTAPRVKVVAAGETWTPAADSTFDYIEVSATGTLKISRTQNTSLKFQTLVILPGGTLDAGTVTDPIPASISVEFVVLNVPIDTTKDPIQWGNGLLNFGHRFMYGAKKLEWTPLTAEVLKGATTIALSQDPAGWAVGDEILVPETDAPAYQTAPRREAPTFVTAISGRNVTFSPALGFDHAAQRDPDGNVVLLPRVANLTRNVSIHSDLPLGTPGHVADVGHGAMWNVGYIASYNLGRTRAATLDSTTADPAHIGTNQVGRYNEHHHHAMGLGSFSIGNVYRGGGPTTAKWAMSVHGTHDALIERNIAIDFIGAGFVTEDGYEVRNVFHQNFGAYNLNPAIFTANPDVALFDAQPLSGPGLNAPGIEGTCAWFRGTANTFDSNECWANGTGINLFNVAQVAGAYPSVAGVPNDTLFPNPNFPLPVLVTGNVAASNLKFGFESWGLNKFPNVNAIASFNTEFQFNYVISNPTKPYLVNPTANGKGGTSKCVSVSSAYTETLDIEGGRITGCNIGIVDGGAIQYVKLTGTFFENVLDYDEQTPPLLSIETNTLHKAMPGHAAQFIQYGRDYVWPGPPAPLQGPPGAKLYYYQSGGRTHVLKNWQGTGKDYRLFQPQQVADTLAWPAGFGQHEFDSPDPVGTTMGQTWAKYGQAWGGEAIDRSKLVTLEGIIAPGLAAEGAATPLGPPLAVLTLPNNHDAPVIQVVGGISYIQMNGLTTGDPTQASGDFAFSVDGGPTQIMESHLEWEGDQRKSGTRTGLASGLHTVKTWRTTTAGDLIPASVLNFTYTVGAIVAPPPPTLCTDPTATNIGQPLPCTFAPPPPPPPADVWTVLLGSTTGPSIRQLVTDGVPQPRYRIYTTATTFDEFVIK